MDNLNLRKISGIFGLLAILADVITILLFLKDLFVDETQIELKYISTQVILIILIFTVAFILGTFALKSDWKDEIKTVLVLFSWIYIIISAIIFISVSARFILLCNYTIIEYFGMVGLIILVTFLALFISLSVDKGNQSFTIPYMIVIICQIGLFTYNFFTRQHLQFDLFFLGNAVLFILTTIFVIVMILVFDRGVLQNPLTMRLRRIFKMSK
jgi:hypothetical protein